MPDFDTVDVSGESPQDPRWAAFLEQLRSRGETWQRYVFRGEIARGGMGAIQKVFDQDARRHLALKVILGQGEPSPTGATPPVDDRSLGRFLEEAQVTSQLDHPGIVPVHEIGVGEDGRVYFTMKLVKGEDLRAIFEKVATGTDGWSVTRALSVLQKVCEAMNYAHAKGVLHRDLKPANVMVGRYGEVYVMDWGLARVLGREDTKDVRPRVAATLTMQSERRDARDTPDAPLVTMDGDVVGTPAYMPPEQAEGALTALGPQSDVYAVGAMLYHLLAGHTPYVKTGAQVSPRTVLAMVLQGDPAPLARENPAAPAELVAICEKAMARDRADRYASMEDLAADLRAYLEHRVVAAYETGAFAELKKWVQRNQALAAAALIAILAVAGGLAGIAAVQRQRRAEAEERTAALEKAKGEFDQLAGVVLLERASAAEESLYPAWPEQVSEMERWLAEDARRLLDLKPALAATLADLEARALAWTKEEREADRTTHPRFAELQALRRKVESLRRAQAVRAGAVPYAAMPLPADLAGSPAEEQLAFASPRVKPDRTGEAFGDEGAALAAARAAVESLEAGDGSHDLADALETLAWALFSNGLDTEARTVQARAGEVATADEQVNYAGSLQRLEDAIAGSANALELAEGSLATLESDVARRRSWRFAEESQRFLHATLTKLAADVAAFEAGPLHGVEQRLAWARRIGDLTLHHPNARVTWDEARDALAKADGVVASTLYREHPIDLKPQTGLVPIGMNPVTLLWEFYELRSACDFEAGEDPAALEIPVHREDGSIEVKDGTGIVFVLIPGGTFLQGAQKEDESAPNYDPWAEGDEVPQEVTLAPYFLARHELTKGQWARLADGDEPSWFQRGSIYDAEPEPIGWAHPVEQVSWTDCDLWMRRSGLSLPTEAQWECGARGGTETPWWTGADPSSLAGAANVLDRGAEARYPAWGRQMGDFEDAFVDVAPVAWYRANPFGLFDVHGNVWELCADVHASRYSDPRAGDGLREPRVSGPANRVYRGGSFINAAFNARAANRHGSVPSIRDYNLGLRPARFTTE